MTFDMKIDYISLRANHLRERRDTESKQSRELVVSAAVGVNVRSRTWSRTQRFIFLSSATLSWRRVLTGRVTAQGDNQDTVVVCT
jgi:hypothetical protein